MLLKKSSRGRGPVPFLTCNEKLCGRFRVGKDITLGFQMRTNICGGRLVFSYNIFHLSFSNFLF